MMERFILIPDSFKGTMSSQEICDIMKKAILDNRPQAKVVCVPVADGGEGSVDAFLTALGGEKRTVKTVNPFFEEIDAFYGIIKGEKTAVVEMAAAAGLPLISGRLDAEKATTYGVGAIILDAVKNGCSKIIMGLGGSATTDGGAGMAAALGVKFTDKNGREFVPTGATLKDIAHIDLSDCQKRLEGIEIITMCDINNPLCGERGAAYVFAPQKGADGEAVKRLDDGLRHFAEVIKTDLGIDIANLAGAGAAGGMGGGMAAFLNSRLQMGIETVLDIVRFDALLQSADCVLTGEGKIDSQSMGGKVVIGVAKRAQKFSVPVIAIVGDIGDNIEAAYQSGVSGIFSINRVAVEYKDAKPRAKSDLYLTVDNLMKFTGAI